MKRNLLLLFLLAYAWTGVGAKNEVSVHGAVIASTSYLWRGERVCGPHVNPKLSVSVGGFTFETYSYLAFNWQYQEIDFDISYKIGDFSVHIADYYFHDHKLKDDAEYFEWRCGVSNHVDEVSFIYESSAIPLNVRWFTFFWGFWLPDGVQNAGRLSLSSYLELETYHEFGKFGTLSLTVGSSVFRGPYTDFKHYFMPVNLGLRYGKTFTAGNFEFPVEAALVVNPYRKTVLAGASVGIAF